MGNTWPMPWMTKNIVTQRSEFVALARKEGANVAELSRRFGVSRKSAYKWLARAEGAEDLVVALADRSRRPRQSPGRTGQQMERQLIALREQHPAWGPRKLRQRLLDLGHRGLPA